MNCGICGHSYEDDDVLICPDCLKDSSNRKAHIRLKCAFFFFKKDGNLKKAKRCGESTRSFLTEKKKEVFKFFRKEKICLEEIIEFEEEEKTSPDWDLETVKKKAMDLWEQGFNPKTKQDYLEYFGKSYADFIREVYAEDSQIQFPEIMRRSYIREKNRREGIRLEEHEKLIHEVIKKKFAFCFKNQEMYDDAFLAGQEGLVVAAGLYNKETASWSTYAWRWIEGKIRRFFENNNPNSMIRVPCHRQKDKEFMEDMQTYSLDKKISSGEDGENEFSSTVSSDVNEKNEESRLMENIREVLSEEFGEEKALCFFENFLYKKKWPYKAQELKEIREYVRQTFYSDR